MVVLSVIVGILLIVAGISCIFTPLATFLAAGYFLCILMLVFGIFGLVRVFQKKAHALEAVSSVLAIIVGIIALFRPGTSLVLDTIVLYAVAIWFVVQGVISAVISIQERKTNSAWVCGLIVGILSVILGILCFVNPMISAVGIGILLGFFFIEIGISLITFSTALGAGEE